MKKRMTATVLALMLGACAAPQRIMGTDEKATPPAGWDDYCRRYPEDPSCN